MTDPGSAAGDALTLTGSVNAADSASTGKSIPTTNKLATIRIMLFGV